MGLFGFGKKPLARFDGSFSAADVIMVSVLLRARSIASSLDEAAAAG